MTGRWVVIAAARRARPNDLASGADASTVAGGSCPFCPGHEAETPPEVYAERDPAAPADSPGWSARVVPNMYPALGPAGAAAPPGGGLYERRDGVGAHEVIIESSEHGAELSQLPLEAVERMLRAGRERSRDLGRDPGFRYVQFFKNHGAAAGASLEHGHAQLVALPLVPTAIEEEMSGAARYGERTGRCVYCDMLAGERPEGRRLIRRDDEMAVLAPWAPRVPYETWIVPARHESAFDKTDDASLRALARALKETLARLRRLLDAPDYNFLVHTAPCRSPRLPHYHWHVEIVPRLQPIAGFEWGTGFTINTMPPEEAAANLLHVEI